MPRTRAFEPEAAVERAMGLFWLQGYSETSVDELVGETGASRYGLYSTFRGKHELFLRALERYGRHVFGPTIARLEAPDASLRDIQGFFQAIRARLRQPDGRRGCLMCNTAVELGPFDASAARRVRKHFRRIRAGFEHALKHARQGGELRRGVDVAASADYLLGVAQGAFVLARAGTGIAAIERFLDTALQQLA